MNRRKVLSNAPFALRITQRKEGKAAIVYQRRPDGKGRDRFQRIGAISPLAFTASVSLLRAAVTRSSFKSSGGDRNSTARDSFKEKESTKEVLMTGPFHPLDADWGARVACFAILSSGLRDAERLFRSSGHLRHADANEAAWWLGMLTRDEGVRPLRALRILTEAVQ